MQNENDLPQAAQCGKRAEFVLTSGESGLSFNDGFRARPVVSAVDEQTLVGISLHQRTNRIQLSLKQAPWGKGIRKHWRSNREQPSMKRVKAPGEKCKVRNASSKNE